MSFPNQQQTEQEVKTEDESTPEFQFTAEEVSIFYNIFTTIVAQVDPASSEGAKALVEACQKAATVITEKGNVAETGEAPTNV